MLCVLCECVVCVSVCECVCCVCCASVLCVSVCECMCCVCERACAVREHVRAVGVSVRVSMSA